MYALCGALLRLLDLALNQKVTTFGAQIFKKKKKAKTTSEHLSVLSLYLFLALCGGQFTFILPRFKLLPLSDLCFCFLLMLVLWNCTADTTKVSVFCDKWISLLVQTSISSLQCFNLLTQYTMLCFTMMGQTECLSQNVCHFVPRCKMLRCEMIPGRVKNKNNTKRTGFIEARSVLTHVSLLCVCAWVYVCVWSLCSY